MVTKLEDTIYQLIKVGCEIRYDCKGYLSYEDSEDYKPGFRYCELVDLFDPKIIRCKYIDNHSIEKFCLYKRI